MDASHIETVRKMAETVRKLEEENQYLRSVITESSLLNSSFEEIRDEINLEVSSSGRIYHPNTRLVFDNLLLGGVNGFTLVCIGSLVGVNGVDEARVLPLDKADYARLASLNRLLADIGLEILPLTSFEGHLSPFDLNKLKVLGVVH